MSSVVISGDTSGSITLQAPAVSGATTLTFPAVSGTVLQSGTTVTEAQGGTGTTIGHNSFKNRIINGDMRIAQRGTTATNTNNTYPVDRFRLAVSNSVVSLQQSSVVPAGAGFVNSIIAISSATTAVGATETYEVSQQIEGNNIADLHWGTANAKPITLSFWVRSSLTGTFGGTFENSGNTRAYPFSYTISTANTWEQKTITVAGDTSGTWLTDNGRGVIIRWSLGCGSSLLNTANTWVAGDYQSVTGETKLVGTNGATWYLTGVQLEKGSTATSFDYRPFGTELQLCQRYFELTGFGNIAIFESGSTYVMNLVYKVTKRAQPSIGLYTTSNIRVRQFGTADRDAASPGVASTAGSTNGGYIKVNGFSSAGATSSVAGIGFTTSAENGDLFSISSEL